MIKTFEEYSYENDNVAGDFSKLAKEEHFEDFMDWVNDGNVIEKSNYYATQDAGYRNKLKTEKDLYNYFVKEFR